MMQRLIQFFFVVMLLVGVACEDPRRSQTEDNLFDPDNSFVRFNYNNTVNTPAEDSVLLKRMDLDTLEVPVALSALPQNSDVLIDFAVMTEGGIMEGEHFELLGENGEPLSGTRRIVLSPGQYDFFITYFEKDTLPPGRSRVILQLEAVEPDFIHLGFPGSGRGSRFDLINE